MFDILGYVLSVTILFGFLAWLTGYFVYDAIRLWTSSGMQEYREAYRQERAQASVHPLPVRDRDFDRPDQDLTGAA